MKRARYLNGDKWSDLGPLPDLRWLYLIAAVAFMVCSVASATWRPEYAQLSPDVQHWYRSQTVPSTGRSCCSEADGVRAEEELRGERHWTRFVAVAQVWDQGVMYYEDHPSGWMEVPEEAILQGPNPNGVPVVWWRLHHRDNDGTWHFTILCYARGAKT